MNKAGNVTTARMAAHIYEEDECCATSTQESDIVAALGYASQTAEHIAETLSRLDAVLSPILASAVPEETPTLRDDTATAVGASIEEIGNRLSRINGHLNTLIRRSGV